jgi:hypothetical protein
MPLDEPAWRRSTRCGTSTCVEVARDGDFYLLRDSKNPDVQAIRFDQASWEDFLGRVRAFDLGVM